MLGTESIGKIELGEIMTKDAFEDLTLLKKGSTQYPDSPDRRTQNFSNKYASRDYTIEFDCPEFTSLCPITGQPDFARIRITYIPDLKCIESKSLKFLPLCLPQLRHVSRRDHQQDT